MRLLQSCQKNGVPLLIVVFLEYATSRTIELLQKFKNIPIPDGAIMDMENTIIFGSDEEWFGRLAITNAEAFDFFRYESQIFNIWSTCFINEKDVVTIQISNTYGQTRCLINMSPKKQ